MAYPLLVMICSVPFHRAVAIVESTGVLAAPSPPLAGMQYWR